MTLNPIPIEKVPELLKETREYLRTHAPQVKNFAIDINFQGYITTYERIDKGPEGYQQVERQFINIEALKKHYGHKPKVSLNNERSDGAGELIAKRGRSLKSKMENAIAKARKRR